MTPELVRAITRCADECHAKDMGEPTANPELAYDALVRLVCGGGKVCRSHGKAVLMTHVDDNLSCEDFLIAALSLPAPRRQMAETMTVHEALDALTRLADEMMLPRETVPVYWDQYDEAVAVIRRALSNEKVKVRKFDGAWNDWIAPFHQCPLCEKSLNWQQGEGAFDNRPNISARCECGGYFAFRLTWDRADRVGRTCRWNNDDLSSSYETGCGRVWEFTAGTPDDNDAKYCPYCGGTIIDVTGNATPTDHSQEGR